MSRDWLFLDLFFLLQLSAWLTVVTEVWKPSLMSLGFEWLLLAWRTWDSAQRPSDSPWSRIALSLPFSPTSIYPESLWYPGHLSQPGIYYLIYFFANPGRRSQEGPLTKEHIQQLPRGQIPNQLGSFTGLERRKSWSILDMSSGLKWE